MAPIKRGISAEDAPRKKSKPSQTHVSKAIREKSQSTSSKPSATSSPTLQTKPSLSVLNSNERSFPRGGASALTPLEKKQIQIQATRDVLFEQAGTKPTKHDFDSDGSDEVEDKVVENERPASKKRKKRSSSKAEKKVEDAEPTVKAEGLSYKRIAPGTIVLGQVSAITSRDITLTLPNNLSGFVPITQVSDHVTEQIEKVLAEEEDESESEEIADVDLRKTVKLGQYLRAYVTSTGDESVFQSGKSKHKIELSVNPRQANTGIATTDIVPGMMLSASVASIEDHGLVMDIGFEEHSTRGFLPSKELDHNLELSNIEEGAVFLCLVTGTSNNGKTVKLSADYSRIGKLQKATFLKDAPTIDAFQPGTAVEMLITDTSASTVSGKIMGMLHATSDPIHSGAGISKTEVSKRFPIGSKMKARITCTFPMSDEKKVGVSFLDHVLHMSPSPSSDNNEEAGPLAALPLSSFVEVAKVIKVQPRDGLFLDVGVKDVFAFAHISRLSDDKIDSISETSGAYKVGSTHRARVVGYNAMDGLFLVSLEPKILQQPFLRVEDVRPGEIVKGKVERLVINERGVGGVLINLADGLSGLVPEMHLADIHLQHPERKFKEGMSVAARVLSTDPERRLIRLTLKKTLVNSDSQIWDDYAKISVGAESPGTLVNILPSGAVVQFYGRVRGFLPVAEMSDTYILDPSQHFRLGQVVSVRVLSIDPESKKMMVSCRNAPSFGKAQQKAFQNLAVGSIISGKVTEKSSGNVTITLQPDGLKAVLRVQHLTDGPDRKNASSLDWIHIGQTLQDLVVLKKLEQRHVIELSKKPSLVKAARSGKFPCKLEEVQEDALVNGFVRGITLQGVFVEFGAELVGLLQKPQMEDSAQKIPDFGFRLGQSITVQVLSIDYIQRRFYLGQRGPKVAITEKPGADTRSIAGGLVNPVDSKCTTIRDYSFGKLTKGRISGIKQSQIHVQLADNVKGRIDASEAFDSWKDIKDPKRPLSQFNVNSVIPVTVLGMHNMRDHRFLPLSHRVGSESVFELTRKTKTKLMSEADVLTLDKIAEGSSWVAFVNNLSDSCIWANLSPNVRGRIALMDLTDDLSRLSDIKQNFPRGSALEVRVKHVDPSSNRLDLVAEAASGTKQLELRDISKGMILPGRVIKTTQRQMIVRLSDNITGAVGLTEITDDYAQANPTAYNKDDVVRVCVVNVDQSNKQIHLSTRPSKVLSSSLPVKDRHVSSISQLKFTDVIRGFVKNVSDKGIFVSISPSITAFVRVAELSDTFIKDWKSSFEIGQLVSGKVIAIDQDRDQVQLSLKASVVDGDYVPPLTIDNVKVGQIVTGKVFKVEAYGVLLLVDNSNNLSGLCPRNEIADGYVDDIRKVYSKGDKVKAMVINVNLEKRRIKFGLKASYLVDAGVGGETDSDSEEGGIDLASDDKDEDMVDGGVGVINGDGVDTEEHGDRHLEAEDDELNVETTATGGLSAGGFDWSGDASQAMEVDHISDADDDPVDGQKKKRRKAEIKVDRTGDLDKYGPQSVADYERQLLGQPNSSSLWIQYMAFQLQLNEVEKAREIAERALKTIHIREEDEKLNVWIALLNLENTYGSDETVEEAFTRACQYNDKQEMHQRLASIYIDSGKVDVSVRVHVLYIR